MNVIRKLAVVIVALESVSVAQADLIEVDFLVAGDGLVTLDTNTNIEWLDLSLTLGLSHNDVTSGIGNTWYEDGWRHARASQMCDLFVAYLGIAASPCPHLDGVVDMDPTLAETFFTFIAPVEDSGQQILNGAYGDFDPALGSGVGQASLIMNSTVIPVSTPHFLRIEGENIGVSPDLRNLAFGNWLVRPSAVPEPTPVPEPGTLALLTLGLAGIGVSCRRKQQTLRFFTPAQRITNRTGDQFKAPPGAEFSFAGKVSSWPRDDISPGRPLRAGENGRLSTRSGHPARNRLPACQPNAQNRRLASIDRRESNPSRNFTLSRRH